MVPMAAWAWAGLRPDPRGWVAADDDPAARWALLTGVLDRLDPWDAGRPLSGHDHRGPAR